jgi:hypothetical protein
MKQLYPSNKENSISPVKSAFLTFAIAICMFGSFAQTAPAPVPKGSTAKAMDEFRSFSVQAANKKMILNWIASADKNTSHYVIQSSFDGSSFDDKAILFTAEDNNNTDCNYKYADNVSSVKADKMYYRLKMVAMDGHYAYSTVATVDVKQAMQMDMTTASITK